MATLLLVSVILISYLNEFEEVIGSYKTMTAKVGPDDLDYDINRVEFRSHFI